MDRGAAENGIKDLQNALLVHTLHNRRFWPNAFRWLLHAAAYWLLGTLRRWLAAVAPEQAAIQLDTLRLRLLKIGGRVRELPGRVRLSLATRHTRS